ncbi:MBL fold metallo-hydrolase [Stenotrophomonas sp. 22385]|uniref:MBL fold metallo-hydrolase n=1 Tax=Stenotrophomonas sp. 22385 TaxID=3453915 RepID=UPI003F87E6B1
MSIIEEAAKRGEQTLVITVHKALAGDLIHINTPCKKSILVDCGHHKDERILDDVISANASIHAIILTHQHLDHFATAAKFITASATSPQLLHSGISFPTGHIPRTSLSTCPHYDGLEQSLWLQYSALIQDHKRWSSVSGLSGVTVHNAIPEADFPNPTDQTYHALNRTATPVVLEFHAHRILIGSDIEGDQLAAIAERTKGPITLFIGSSHGRPSHNPDVALSTLKPRHICLTDSFEGSDFTHHFKASQPDSDVRSVNIDGTQRYTFLSGGALIRESLRGET